MIATHQKHLWFKFKLRHLGGEILNIRTASVHNSKFSQRDHEGRRNGKITKHVLLNYKLNQYSKENYVGNHVPQC
jgi:hypothetical protein